MGGPAAGANDNKGDEWVYLRNGDEAIGHRGDREMTNDNLALDFLSLFLNSDFWNFITTETNRYAHQLPISF